MQWVQVEVRVYRISQVCNPPAPVRHRSPTRSQPMGFFESERLESTSTSSGETISGPASLTAPPTASALMSDTGGSGPMGPKSLVHCEVPTAAFEALCQHRESGVLQEAGFKKRGLAPCPRLPAFWTWVTDPSCNIPGCGFGSRKPVAGRT